jgi:protein ImuB
MPRLACVNLPEFPLQILLMQHPPWRREAVAVISVDSPNGHILSINGKARDRGVRRGMRYATALTLEPRLQAGVVSESLLEEHRERVVARLRRFAPEIELCDFDLGTLWIDVRGLFPLFDSFSTWMDAITETLEEEGLLARIAVGFSRFGSYLVASSSKAPTLLHEPLEERRTAARASLELLPLPPKARRRLVDLGLYTVRDFLQLPGSEVARRLGAEAAKVYHFASGDLELPFQSLEEEQEFSYTKNLTAALSGLDEIMVHLDELLERLIVEVTEARLAVQKLWVGLYFEDGASELEEIAPATATTRPALLRRLLRLRLGGLTFSSRIEGVRLSCDTREVRATQGALFGGENHRHDWGKAAKAFSLIQAEFGNRSVAVAQTQKGYLPEEQYAWVDDLSRFRALSRKPEKSVTIPGVPTVVRRILSTPLLLKEEPRGGFRAGPFLYSGGWWSKSYDRAYYYVDDDRGTPLWLYYDKKAGRWMLQGAIQ